MSGSNGGLRRRFIKANKKVMDGARSADARQILETEPQHGDFGSLDGHTYLLLVTYKRNGDPVPTPVWFGKEGDCVFVWTEENAYKAKRLRRDERAIVAPCGPRGEPLGSPVAARGRVLDDESDRRHAAQVIRGSWGWFRRAFERASRPLTGVVYIELKPA